LSRCLPARALADGRLTLAEAAVLARHANAKVTAQVYAGLSESGREGIACRARRGRGRQLKSVSECLHSPSVRVRSCSTGTNGIPRIHAG
jgi:hypothetical protein